MILQPRRLAARMLAKRVAEERGVQLGAEVGYQIRLDNVSSPATRILFVTEGVLLRQILANPRLEGTSVVIFDEFHERHLYSDITLSCALDLQASHRPDLGIIVMSATLDGARLESYLAPCQTLSSEGRMFPWRSSTCDTSRATMRPRGSARRRPSPRISKGPRETFSFSCRALTRFSGQSGSEPSRAKRVPGSSASR